MEDDNLTWLLKEIKKAKDLGEWDYVAELEAELKCDEHDAEMESIGMYCPYED